MPLEEQKPLLSKPTAEAEGDASTRRSLFSNKGLIIAAIIVIIALVIGASTLIGLGSTDQYQGYIRDLDTKLQDQQTVEVVQPEATTEIQIDTSQEPPSSPLPTELDEDTKIVR